MMMETFMRPNSLLHSEPSNFTLSGGTVSKAKVSSRSTSLPQDDQPMQRRQRRERAQDPLAQLARPDQKTGHQVPHGDPARHQVREPGQPLGRLDHELREAFGKSGGVSSENDPRERLVGIHHGIVLIELPTTRRVIVRLGMKMIEE